MSKRQITIKPTCMREISAFPSDRASLLWDKINSLVTDPFPDGKVKKRLKASKGIYRMRVTDYRVFYRFGEDWVSLLGVRRRAEDTYQAVPQEIAPPPLPPDFEDDLDVLTAPAPKHSFDFVAEDAPKPLPFALTPQWLRELGVPASAYPVLTACRTEDDLLEAAVPETVLDVVLDAVFPPSLEHVAEQPDLVVPSTEHLVRYKEGDLLGFLLRLDDDQMRLAHWALQGPTMVRGGAGTGKSTVALHRVKAVLDRPEASGKERLLFATYTRALLTVTRQLLEQILTPAQMDRVRVVTCDQLAWEIVSSQRRLGKPEGDAKALSRLQALRRTFQPTASTGFETKLRSRALQRLSDAYLLEEFDWIIEGRGLATLDEYREAPRPGRGVPFPERLRETVWEIYQIFAAGSKGERFPRLRNEALEIVRRGDWKERWDHVFVDEAQDLSPSALALMAEVCQTPEGIFFAADAKQSIYSKNYGWTAAHPRLQFRGRTAFLKRNYRSTREVDEAAFSLLQPEGDEALEPSTSVHEGPLPVLVKEVPPEKQVLWVVRFVRQMSRHLRMRPNAAAVLVPGEAVGRRLAEEMSDEGLPSVYFPGRELDLLSDAVKITTLYSAKGLEFPIVVVCGFEEGTYPAADNFGDEGLFEERMRHERRLLYVALTRAMRGLMLMVPTGCAHPVLTGLDDSQWHVKEGR